MLSKNSFYYQTSFEASIEMLFKAIILDIKQLYQTIRDEQNLSIILCLNYTLHIKPSFSNHFNFSERILGVYSIRCKSYWDDKNEYIVLHISGTYVITFWHLCDSNCFSCMQVHINTSCFNNNCKEKAFTTQTIFIPESI